YSDVFTTCIQCFSERAQRAAPGRRLCGDPGRKARRAQGLHDLGVQRFNYFPGVLCDLSHPRETIGPLSRAGLDQAGLLHVADFENTTCQKSILGLTNAIPTNRLSRFSRKEVTTQSTELAVCSLKTLTVWPGIKGVSMGTKAPCALTM